VAIWGSLSVRVGGRGSAIADALVAVTWCVPVCIERREATVGHEASDPHRVDPNDNRRVHLDRQLHPDLITCPQIPDLGRLTLG
jgi:hypothetical protein